VKKIIFASALAVMTCYALVSCSKKNSAGAPATPFLSLSANSTVNSTIIVDSSGRSVYNFVFDAQGKGTCLSGCAITWPHEYFKGLSQDDLGAGLNIADFGTVTNADGSMQTTYKGHPMYIFSGDKKTAGVWTVTGNDIEGGTWFAGQPNFTVFISNNRKNTGADSAFLTTPNGLALYTTTASTVDASLVAFKPAGSTVNVPARTSNADFAINGSGALTYNGSILYTSTADATPGEINGTLVSNTSLVIIP
jgi:predicted lipoprotein with Yx(FWY)xxD motif